MKLAIVAPGPPDPSVVGGAERLWNTLGSRLSGRGHDVDLLVVPTPEDTLEQVLDSYERFADLDVGGYDAVITGKYPAWMVRHPRHLLYLLHPLRGLYDTYPRHLAPTPPAADAARLDRQTTPAELLTTARAMLTEDPGRGAFPGPFARAVVHRLDRMAYRHIETFAAISEEVAGREDYVPDDVPVLVVHPESVLASESLGEPLGAPPHRTAFLAVSRLDHPKRIDLVVESFRLYSDPGATLTVAGDGPERSRLEQLAEPDSRVRFVGRVADDELRRLTREATAVVFVPEAEDYGYITHEAMAGGTPVVTTNDSGGAKELVEHGVNGMIVEPRPASIAQAMAVIGNSPFVRWHLGLNARRRANTISFDPLLHLIEQLASAGTSATRPRALILSTYGIEPMVGGGQRRVRNLARVLGRSSDVTVLALSSRAGRTRRRLLEPGLVQIDIPRSTIQLEAEQAINRLIGLPVDDITASDLAPATPAYLVELHRQLERADVVISSHPFLAPLVPTDTEVPVVHDSHNHEAALKAAMLPDTEAARHLVAKARHIESAATSRAAALIACTEGDLAVLHQQNPAIPGHLVPNGVDTRALPAKTPEQAALARRELLALTGADPDDPRPIALFIGSWHLPNIEAGRLIIGVARRRADWIFILAGSHTSALSPGPTATNVLLLPQFAECMLWPLLAGADVALNPMLTGGGSNLKLFDYLAVGTPVLTSEVGARGLPDPERAVITCATTIEGISSGLDELRRRPTAERIAYGRALVEQQFDWQVLGTRWSEAILATVPSAAPALPASPPLPAADTGHEAPPILAGTNPPASDPAQAAIRCVGRLARTEPPPPKPIVDPFRTERGARADEVRHPRRLLPDSVRARAPEPLVRVRRAVSSRRLDYRGGLRHAVDRLARTVRSWCQNPGSLPTADDGLTPDPHLLSRPERERSELPTV